MKHLGILFSLVLSLNLLGQEEKNVFTNPLLNSGADPWITFHDGWYYYTHTVGYGVEIRKTKNPVDLKNAERKKIWIAPDTGSYSSNVWAPEIHYVRGNWYVYFAADNGENKNHRMWVIGCDSQDPMEGEWSLKGKLDDKGDHWAIDGSVLDLDGKLYMAWSGWESYSNGKQHIYIAEMENPWTLKGERVKISSPTEEWELNGLSKAEAAQGKHTFVNEGPQFLQHKDDLSIIFSANGCWTDHYSLGSLKLKPGGDLLNPDDWKKSEGALLTTSEENGVFAPGHNSFFTSPDGKENWILYHANPRPKLGCGGKRSPRAQPFTWDEKGNPVFPEPASETERLTLPGGIKLN